jgi:hypothetical protein
VDIKAIYRRFRQWQLNPVDNEFTSSRPSLCNNCGHEFVGNYCPYCSQKRGIGRITWKSVAKGIGEVWGLHNRSMFYTLVQLFLRPGYFISDYIGGKRQVSFPPVKMLVLIGVLGVIVDFLTGAIHGMVYSHGEKMGYVNDVFNWLNVHVNGMFPPPSEYLSGVLNWLNTHPDVFSLILLSFLIIPIYFIFRFAPRNTRHSIPQGFFIQVFSTAVFMVMNMLYDITALGWLVVLLSIVLIFVTYKQLFGYGLWGTLWRLVMAFLCAFTLLSVMLNFNYGIYLLEQGNEETARGFFLNVPIALLILIVILAACYFISKPRKPKPDTTT